MDYPDKPGNDEVVNRLYYISFMQFFIPKNLSDRMSAFVYIVASRKYGTLYIGVTNDLGRRIFEHRAEDTSAFTAKYNVTRLVYYEVFETIAEAINREKRLKKWPRAWKVRAIEENNPEWKYLYETLNM